MNDGKYVIVHVDDSLLAREMVREAFTKRGCEVYSAEHAQDFEQRLMVDPALRAQVDFVVLDMEMPDLTGAQVGAVMDVVFEELTEVPFIIFSAKEQEWVEARVVEVAEGSPGFQRNFQGYMGKTVDGADALADRVKLYLDQAPKGAGR
jgi:CheY-like chemotaxis protein